MSPKVRSFWPLLLSVLLTDCATKQFAIERLAPVATPHEVLGDWVRLVLVYNRGAAMGLSLGSWARPLLAVVTVAMLGLLWVWYRRTRRRDWMTAAALGLIAGGALGNLLDRLRWDRGVVDFIDIGWGSVRFWTFNVADVGITCGALWLAWRLSRRQAEPPEPAAV
ncbi:MAG TPA: signal peptidase II [Gemmatimonadales bacterium]